VIPRARVLIRPSDRVARLVWFGTGVLTGLLIVAFAVIVTGALIDMGIIR
jgi:hypothetical protein